MNTWAIQTFELGYKYPGGVTAVEDLGLNIRRGDVYALMGPSGCGKTTLLALLAGQLKTQAGRVEVFGYDPHKYRTATSCLVGTVLDANATQVQGYLTVRETLESHCRRFDLPNSRLHETMELTTLTKMANRQVRQLSAGMKRRLSIGIALLPRPALLILDEPSKGLDLPGRTWLASLLRDLNQAAGVTILMSSQCTSEVRGLSTHIGIMNSGRLVFQGTWDDLEMGNRPKLLIHTSNNMKAADLLRNYPLEITQEGLCMPYLDEYQTAMINRELVGHKLDVYILRPGHPDLGAWFTG
jgi:ABC-type multidrug transport system ATPase subunit